MYLWKMQRLTFLRESILRSMTLIALANRARLKTHRAMQYDKVSKVTRGTSE